MLHFWTSLLVHNRKRLAIITVIKVTAGVIVHIYSTKWTTKTTM